MEGTRAGRSGQSIFCACAVCKFVSWSDGNISQAVMEGRAIKRERMGALCVFQFCGVFHQIEWIIPLIKEGPPQDPHFVYRTLGMGQRTQGF